MFQIGGNWGGIRTGVTAPRASQRLVVQARSSQPPRVLARALRTSTNSAAGFRKWRFVVGRSDLGSRPVGASVGHGPGTGSWILPSSWISHTSSLGIAKGEGGKAGPKAMGGSWMSRVKASVSMGEPWREVRQPNCQGQVHLAFSGGFHDLGPLPAHQREFEHLLHVLHGVEAK